MPFSPATSHGRVRLARLFFRFRRLLLFVSTCSVEPACGRLVAESITGSVGPGMEGVSGRASVGGEAERGVRGDVPKASSNSLSRASGSISIVRPVDVGVEVDSDVRGDVPNSLSNSLSRMLGSISITRLLGGEEGVEDDGDGDGDGDGELRGDVPKKRSSCRFNSSSSRASVGPRSSSLY